MSVIGHGVEIVTSGTRPASPFTGQMIYDDTTESFLWYTGSAWVGVTPAGTVNPYAGSSAPPGWLFCYGQTLDSTTNPEYADLFSAIGTTYGGSGASSFIVPDLRGRTPFGLDDMGGAAASRLTSVESNVNGASLGASGGDQRLHLHSHSVPSHSHSINHGHTASGSQGGWREASTFANGWSGFMSHPTTGVSPYGSNGVSVSVNNHSGNSGNWSGNTGNIGAASSQNIPPAIVLNYIIKY